MTERPSFAAIAMSPEAARTALAALDLAEERRSAGVATRRVDALRIGRESQDAGFRLPRLALRAWSRGAVRLARSGLFLDRWYAAEQRINSGAALSHYLRHGIARDHAPNPFFDPVWYRAIHLAAQADEAPIWHYLRVGAMNALAPGPLFDPVVYLEHNPDLAQEPDLLAHFLALGIREGRRFFDAR